MRTDDQIQQEIEEFLLSGFVFEYILRSNPTIYKDKLGLLSIQNPDDELTFNFDNINFNYKPDGIKFIGKPIIKRFAEDYTGSSNYYEALYISDFNFEGFIYVSELNQIELKFEATLRIFARNSQVPNINGWIEIPKIINVLDKNAYMVWKRQDKQTEIKKLEDLLHINIE